MTRKAPRKTMTLAEIAAMRRAYATHRPGGTIIVQVLDQLQRKTEDYEYLEQLYLKLARDAQPSLFPAGDKP